MGQEGGHFLEPPPDAPLYMPDDHYRLALQRRLLAPINSSTTQCRNRNDTQTCNHALHQHEHHALTCGVGTMRIQRHDHIVTALHNWLKTRCAWT